MFSITAKHYRQWVGLAIIVHFFVLMLLGLSRHWGFMTSINDLGIFDQAVWGVLHGESLLNTSKFNQPFNWLGFHFHPILFIFVPLYVLIPSVIWFTTAQAFALSITAWPIFLMASRVFQSEKAGFLWALVYLVNPFILNAATWDFHPITLAVPFVAMSMLSIETKNFRTLFLSCLVILSCKEHLGIMVIGFGFLWGIHNKSWKPAIGLILLGIVHFALVLGIIMPVFSPTGEHPMFNKGIGEKGRYSWLGDSFKEVFNALLFHPITVAKVILLELGGATYFLVLMMFFLGFTLFAPRFLLPGLADLATNMLSAVSMPKSPFAYHNATLVPVLIAAAIYGTLRIFRWTKKFSAIKLTGLVLIANFTGGYLLAPLPLPGAINFWKPDHFLSRPDPRVQMIRSLVGENASVSAQANVGSHFSQRHEIYRYPNMVGQADAIILRLESPTKNINNLSVELMENRRYYLQMLDSHLQMDRTEYIASIKSLLSDNKYGVLLWDDPWLVLAQGTSSHGLEQKLEQKLNRLQKEWKINSNLG